MSCPICGKSTILIDKIDLDRDCLGLNVLSGTKFVEYYGCTTCGFCYSPEMYLWAKKQFAEDIYNDDYQKYDPDFISLRSTNNAKMLSGTFFKDTKYIRHLDYGGGLGLLSSLLNTSGWDSSTYDPFIRSETPLGKYSLITAFEVFEHTTNPQELIQHLTTLLSNKGILIFSTLLSDEKIRKPLDWWYVAPRNGHISIFSQLSLRLLAKQNSLNFISFSGGMHAMWKKVPNWAEHIIKR